jgi:hypothetical protein
VQGITYTSALPVLGGQAAFTVLAAPGNVGVGIGGTLTGPLGNTVSGVETDNRITLADVFYQGTLQWNQGLHSEMVYATGNIPSGTYDSSGWSTWATFSISPQAPEAPPTARPIVRKY